MKEIIVRKNFVPVDKGEKVMYEGRERIVTNINGFSEVTLDNSITISFGLHKAIYIKDKDMPVNFRCNTCGALVEDMGKHSEYHDSITIKFNAIIDGLTKINKISEAYLK